MGDRRTHSVDCLVPSVGDFVVGVPFDREVDVDMGGGCLAKGIEGEIGVVASVSVDCENGETCIKMVIRRDTRQPVLNEDDELVSWEKRDE